MSSPSAGGPASHPWAVVLAAGTGARFGGRKQCALLAGRRLVDLAVEAVAGLVDGVVVVWPSGVEWDGPAVAAVVAGGAARADSVRAGLSAVPEDADIVIVHDAAHPRASPGLALAVLAALADPDVDAAAPVIPVTETILELGEGVVVAAHPGAGRWLLQLPYAIRAGILRRVHVGAPAAPEDITLVVAAGGRVAAVPGEPGNLHVSTPPELALAAAGYGLTASWS